MARCKGCIHENVCNREVGYGYSVCPHYINSADVVPKSEVDLYKKQVDELEDELASTYDKLENAKAEVAREIFTEIDRIIFGTIIPNDCAIISIARLAELKKKYTGEKT